MVFPQIADGLEAVHIIKSDDTGGIQAQSWGLQASMLHVSDSKAVTRHVGWQSAVAPPVSSQSGQRFWCKRARNTGLWPKRWRKVSVYPPWRSCLSHSTHKGLLYLSFLSCLSALAESVVDLRLCSCSPSTMCWGVNRFTTCWGVDSLQIVLLGAKLLVNEISLQTCPQSLRCILQNNTAKMLATVTFPEPAPLTHASLPNYSPRGHLGFSIS